MALAPGQFWVGSNGNLYSVGPTGGVLDNGAYNTNLQTAVKAGMAVGSPLFTQQINDPNPPKPATTDTPPPPPVDPNNRAGSGTATPDKSNDIQIQNAGLGAVDQQTAAGLAAVDKSLAGILGQYDTEKNTNQTSYQTNSDQNQNNLQKNKQTALVNAAMGRQGLLGTLSSIGALSGSGIELADRAVQRGANTDLASAGDNFSTNQSSLDTAIGQFNDEDARRRQDAETAAEDAKTNVNNQGSKDKQTFFSNLANDYADENDTANAKKYTDLAASLFPNIAATNIPSTNLAYTGAAFTPTTLKSYLAGNNTAVSTTPASGGKIPGLVATTAPAKKKVTA